MKLRISLILGMAFSLIFISAGLIFSQEQIGQEEPVMEERSGVQAQEVLSQPEMQWVWGEVVSVDMNTKQMLVKYLDYETDNEKEININVDDKTTYENVKSVEEIRSQDTVSIDYIIDPNGSNIARNISVEKPEGQETLQEENTRVETEPVSRQ